MHVWTGPQSHSKPVLFMWFWKFTPTTSMLALWTGLLSLVGLMYIKVIAMKNCNFHIASFQVITAAQLAVWLIVA